MRGGDTDDDVGDIDERLRGCLDELDAPVQATARRRPHPPVERLPVGVDPGAGRRWMRRENAEQELAPATAEIEHVVAG